MESVRAEDLPDLSVVADDETAWIKSHTSNGWRGTNSDFRCDGFINDQLNRGAQVLRVGGMED